MSDDEEDTVLWSMTCNSCDNEWMQVTPADSTPAVHETNKSRSICGCICVVALDCFSAPSCVS